jgi:hypothetical protein
MNERLPKEPPSSVPRSRLERSADTGAERAADDPGFTHHRVVEIRAIGGRVDRRLRVEHVQDVYVKDKVIVDFESTGHVDADERLHVALLVRQRVAVCIDRVAQRDETTVASDVAVVFGRVVGAAGIVRRGAQRRDIEVQRVLPATAPALGARPCGQVIVAQRTGVMLDMAVRVGCVQVDQIGRIGLAGELDVVRQLEACIGTEIQTTGLDRVGVTGAGSAARGLTLRTSPR